MGEIPSAITIGSKLIGSQAAPFCVIAWVRVRVPTCTSLRSFGHGLVGSSCGSPAWPTAIHMSQRTGPLAARSIRRCSRKSAGSDFISASLSCFSPSSGTNRQRTGVTSPLALVNLKVWIPK
ncbi:hypothetical protein D3C78_1491600 [compost metagenome]